MFNVCKHAVFTLFALTLIKKQCNAEYDEMAQNVKHPQTLVMDDLDSFNMTYYCKFQANDNICNDHRRSRRYFFDTKQHRCRWFEYGNCDHSYNMFDDKRICVTTCRDEALGRVSEDVTANVYCRYQPDFGDCNQYQPSFYYDISERKCKGFAYSGCGGNRNRFNSMILCTDACQNAVRHKEVQL